MRNNFQDTQFIYNKMFSFIDKQSLFELPIPLDEVCKRIKIDLVPLSKIIDDTGLQKKEIFKMWGNENGHLMPCNKNGTYKFKIAFNDSYTHRKRKYFTIAEEITHYVLKHYENPMYSIFNPAPWDEELYQKHEEAARTGAGFLIFPPMIFYEKPNSFNIDSIAQICGISKQCAEIRYSIMKKYKWQIERNPKYIQLLNGYHKYILNLNFNMPSFCYLCGNLHSDATDICASCYNDLFGVAVFI